MADEHDPTVGPADAAASLDEADSAAASASEDETSRHGASHASAPPPAPRKPAESRAKTASSDDDELLVTPGMNWFVLRVASNKENSVRETLLRKIKIEGYEHLVNRILVPTEKTKTMKAGKTRVALKMLYPGYVFVEMKLEDDGRIPQDVFFLIKETTGVGDFIGTAGRPSPMPEHEVVKMLEASKEPEESPEVKMEFQKGDPIKIMDGPFENYEGVVDELLPAQGKVRVVVTIFGRAAPLEIEYWQIEKVEE